jgi:hypothetical protein
LRIDAAMRLQLEHPGPHPAATFKIKLPASWSGSPVSRVKELFAESYAKKHPASAGWLTEFHLLAHDGRPLPDSVIVGDVLREHDVVRAMPGKAPETLAAQPPAPSTAAAGSAGSASGGVLCRNYGCLQRYDPAADTAAAATGGDEGDGGGPCAHHTAPPTFRDTSKVWPCCGASHWDWDEFMALPRCACGPHSDADPGPRFAPPAAAAPDAASVTAATPLPTAAASAPAPPAALKSIEAYNVANPDAPTAAASVARSFAAVSLSSSSSSASAGSPAPAVPAQTPRASDGRLLCRRVGCGKWFLPGDGATGENAEGACVYHGCGAPVFHDGIKSWACTPGKAHVDWEGFTGQPGCVTGRHQG